MTRELGRLITAMVTPFDAAGAVDLAAAARLARGLVAAGCDGVVVNGTTGESPTLTEEERLALLDAVRAAVPDRPVIMGTGSYATAATLSLTREAQARGADAALVVTPYYSKPPQAGLVAHFEAVADLGVPVILYNIPGRTGVNISVETTLRLSAHPMIVATKEAAGDVDQVARIVAEAPAGFAVYSGDDPLYLPMAAVGAVGVISVAAHVCAPAMRRLVDAVTAGDLGTATALHLELLPLFHDLFTSSNPIPVKAALAHLGIDCGGVRPPLAPLDAEQRRALGSLLDRLGRLVHAPAEPASVGGTA